MTSILRERITIGELSKEYLINTAVLKSIFKGINRQPIGTYKKEYRIRQVALLLHQIQENIAAIANQIGCENQNNSAVTFRDVMKIAPIEYKKHNIGE